MRQYNVTAKDVYNVDKKGFAIGITTRLKQVFT